MSFLFFFFNDTATTEIYTLSLHDALPISQEAHPPCSWKPRLRRAGGKRLLRLLRRRGRRAGRRLLQLRPGGLAHYRAELEPGHEPRLASGALAPHRPRRAPHALHAGVLALRSLQLGHHAWQRSANAAAVAGPVRGLGRRRLVGARALP